MPRGDRTGPYGMGPRTGRGMGFCGGNNTPGFMNPGRGYRGYRRIFGGMRGRGRGFCRWFMPWGLESWFSSSPQSSIKQSSTNKENITSTNKENIKDLKDEEIEILKEQAKYFKDALKNIEDRIKDLESQNWTK